MPKSGWHKKYTSHETRSVSGMTRFHYLFRNIELRMLKGVREVIDIRSIHANSASDHPPAGYGSLGCAHAAGIHTYRLIRYRTYSSGPAHSIRLDTVGSKKSP